MNVEDTPPPEVKSENAAPVAAEKEDIAPPGVKPGGKRSVWKKGKVFSRGIARRFLLLLGFENVLKARHHPTKTKRRVVGAFVEKMVCIMGFSGVVAAWKQPTKKTKKILTSLFNKAADMAAGKVVVTSIKLVTISVLAGMVGGSIYMTMGLTALATGAGSAVYTYCKALLQERVKLGKKAAFFSKQRLKDSAFAFAKGAAGGAFGAWVIKTDLVQGAFHAVKGVFVPDGNLTQTFNSNSSPAVLMPAPATVPFAAPAR